ncbi:hypothetical protein MTYP_03081 [Methylophilaceae bacterium]|nr:hypothetical protein MTYP_03081 [Methylophilaceae bacterium]
MKKKTEHLPVSHLPAPVRKPPPRTLRDREAPLQSKDGGYALVEHQPAYLVLRVVTPGNTHLFDQETPESADETK